MKPILNGKRLIGMALLISLVLSIIYTIIRLYYAPTDLSSTMDVKTKSDYVLMLIQCILGLLVMAIPSLIERKLSMDIPDYLEVMYFIFLFCAIFLGEVWAFYYLIPYWDLILHAFSSVMLGALGFYLVNFFVETEHPHVTISPFFIALFAFCFAMTCSTAWEIYEFVVDGALGTNMQKFILADGTILIGREALSDTMMDFIIHAISSLIVSIAGFFMISKKEQ